jgi:hypothetical protein
METNTINAAANPDLANELIDKALKSGKENETPKEVKITYPPKLTVELPGGYLSPSGELAREATVRELTGADEEAVARVDTVGKALLTILYRATVSIGDEPATEELLDQLLVADREAILLGIYKATFGSTYEVTAWFDGEAKQVDVDLDEEIEIKRLDDPVGDREFTVTHRGREFLLTLPMGIIQKEIFKNPDKTSAEMGTFFLENTVLSIDGERVYRREQVRDLGISYRNKINEEIAKRNPGPRFSPVRVTDPESGAEAVIPISLGTLFRL